MIKIISLALFGMSLAFSGAPARETVHEFKGQGEPCVNGKCSEGLSCVKYFGIAGPRGPEFNSCDIPCADQKVKCPTGQSCITVADGPGQVCRPGNLPLR